KALAADVQRNLRAPLVGISQEALKLGLATPDITIGMRTGDTPASERRQFGTKPPDILVTTPESLFLILTSAARTGLSGVETVIIDEIHALAGTKRGAHLALSLERLDALLEAGGSRPAQRIGLSATVEPAVEVARFLGGNRPLSEGGRETEIVAPPASKKWQIDLVVPVADMTDLTGSGPVPLLPESTAGPADSAIQFPGPDLSGLATSPERKVSMWPHVQERITDLVADHTATLVFTNSRRGAERLTARLNEIWATRSGYGEPNLGQGSVHQIGKGGPAAYPGMAGISGGLPADAPIIARTHHGSMSRTERLRTESELKAGTLPAVVATSSLELGIDMGEVDLVVQVGAPPSVASGLQRIGRAGHQVGAVSHGVVFPTHRGDLIPATVIAERMRQSTIEPLKVPRTPLDVLAQQVVAALAVDEWTAPELLKVMRRAYPFGELGDATWYAVLDMLAGRYPSEDFGELRARITWDRATGVLTGRPGALRLAATSGGTIPDRGLYGVFLAGSEGDDQRGGKRVGELDEEMVFESRVGDTFTLGNSTWRIEEITPNQVNVTPAPGLPGRLPFWRGDQPMRPVELGRAIGAFTRELDTALRRDEAEGRAMLTSAGLDDWAVDNLVAHLAEQRTATGQLPDDRTIIVERFRDELGEWRVVIHNTLGNKVNAPWALVIAGRLRMRLGVDVSAVPADNGIILRLPDADWGVDEAFGGTGGEGGTGGMRITAEDLLIDPETVAAEVREQLGGSVLFAARFREAAGRALLLPRRHPNRRQPLWQQRLRAAQLLQVASEYPEFPIVLEAAREVLQEDFDTAALSGLQRDLANGQIRLIEITGEKPSPFASDLVFGSGYTAEFLYNGDAPLAERRVAALALDPDLLNELLGSNETFSVAELLDEGAVHQYEQEISRQAPGRQARDVEGVWDLLQALGPMTADEVRARTVPDADSLNLLEELVATRRSIKVRLAGREVYANVEDASRLRDGFGVALPTGLPEEFTRSVADPVGDLVRRYLRTSGPVGLGVLAERFGLGQVLLREVLNRLVAAGLLVTGELRPRGLGGTGEEWADPEVMRRLRRRSLAALRSVVEPVDQAALGVFLPHWQQVGSHALSRGSDGLLRAVEQLAGFPVPASALETLILPARIPDYRPEFLTEATASGEVIWVGHNRLPGSGGGDGMVSLHLAADAPWTLPLPTFPPLPATTHDDDAATPPDLAARIYGLLRDSGGFFLPRLAELAEASQSATLEALWDLVWAGLVTNDTIVPLREAVGAGVGGAHRAPKQPGRGTSLRAGRFAGLGRPTTGVILRGGGGRWSAVPEADPDPTRRAHALAQILLDRHGVLTKSVAPLEGLGPGGTSFPQLYQVLKELEERGKVRRGYFVEGLGGSQFASPGAVDLLRSDAADRTRITEAPANRYGVELAKSTLLLAATDPANPYGAALPWPAAVGDVTARPGRKAGAVVVLANGELALYVERGGRTLLTFGAPEILEPALGQLVAATTTGKFGRLTIQKVNGEPALQAVKAKSEVATALVNAGFAVTPSGLRVG
ncbi:MAG: DEAD/DEAH box helicase, partial [Promicromonosporaceae bacterium]|nr:DEAD/DEAH box helicase [Promicromonosporaceae bacterium]